MSIDHAQLAHLSADSLAASEAIAQQLAPLLRAGDVVTLVGGLGAGKTAFARALINALPGAPEDVPSPTFTLVQTYPRGDLEVWHFDLYRLEDPEEAFELGIEDAFIDALSLIEWPDRLGPYLPKAHLRVTLTEGETEAMREITFSGDSAWAQRLDGLFSGDDT